MILGHQKQRPFGPLRLIACLRNLRWIPFFRKPNRARKFLAVLLLTVAFGLVCGCRTFTFYVQAARGQLEMVSLSQPMERVLADTNAPPLLKERLALVRNLREFAENDLKLPVDGHYLKYADLHRPFVVWNVEAAPEFSMEPKTWWYPLVGSLAYRGYFHPKGAENYAAHLRKRQYDVFIGGVSAYSTLGWFKDPILSTFLFEPEPDVAETIFHELGHQRVFAHGDTDFNEAFATTVGQEGARRWLMSINDQAALEKYLAQVKRTRQFAALVMAARGRLEELYGDERDPDGKVKATTKKAGTPKEVLRTGKKRIFEDLDNQYRELKRQWGDITDYEAWFAREVNNAQLNSVAAYYDLVPGFEHLLELNSGDLEKFYAAAERLSKTSKPDRHQWLRSMAKPAL